MSMKQVLPGPEKTDKELGEAEQGGECQRTVSSRQNLAKGNFNLFLQRNSEVLLLPWAFMPIAHQSLAKGCPWAMLLPRHFQKRLQQPKGTLQREQQTQALRSKTMLTSGRDMLGRGCWHPRCHTLCLQCEPRTVLIGTTDCIRISKMPFGFPIAL